MMLALIFLPMTVMVVALIMFLLSALEKRARALRLDWPDDITFIGMKTRFKLYMKSSGWKVRLSDDIVYQFVVNKKGGDDFVVYCSQANDLFHNRSILDLIAAKRRYGSKPVLFVFTKTAPLPLVVNAYENGIYMLHYSQLPALTAMPQSSLKRLRMLIRQTHNLPDTKATIPPPSSPAGHPPGT